MADLQLGAEQFLNQGGQGGSILQQVAPQYIPTKESNPDLVTSADVISRIESEIEKRGLSYAEATAFRQQNYDLLQRTYDFQQFDNVQRGTLRQKWETRLPNQVKAQYENLDPNDPNNRLKIQYYNDFNNIRNGLDTETSGFDAFTDNFLRSSVVGGIGYAVSDFFNPEDVRDSRFGDDTDFIKNSLLDVAKVYDDKLARDWKVGAVAGTLTGMASDVASTMLIGGITGLGGTMTAVGKSVGASTASALGGGTIAKAIGASLRVAIPSAVAGFEYLGETAVLDFVEGELNSREDIATFASNIPGRFAMGMALGAVGEGVGHIVNNIAQKRVAKNISEFTSGKSIGSKMSLAEETSSEVDRLMNRIKYVSTPEADKAFYDELIADGYSVHNAKNIVAASRQASLYSKVHELKDDAEIQDLVMSHMYKADFDRDGTDMIFKSFLGEDLDAPVRVRNEQEFYGLLAEKSRTLHNKVGNEMFGRVSAGAPITNVKVITKDVTSTAKIPTATVQRAFGASDNPTNTEAIRGLTDIIFPEKAVKIVGVDDLANIPESAIDELAIYVPNKISSPKQARNAMSSFFAQASAQGKKIGQDIAYDIDDISRFFNQQVKFSYDKKFLDDIGAKASIVKDQDGNFLATLTLRDGTVEELMSRGKPALFATEEEAIEKAGLYAHTKSIGGTSGIMEDMAEKGYKAEIVESGNWRITDKDGELLGEAPLEVWMKDPMTQPKVAYDIRPDSIEVRVLGQSTTEAPDMKGKSVMEASEMLAKFKTRPSGYIELKPDGDFRIFAGPTGVQLTNPLTGFTKNFDTGIEAKNFLEANKSKWDSLWNRAADQGYTLTYTRGAYVVSNGAERHVFKSTTTVDNFLGRSSALRLGDQTPTHLKDVISSVKNETFENISKTSSKIKEDAELYRATKKYVDQMTDFERLFKPATNAVNQSKNITADRIDRGIGSAIRRANAGYIQDTQSILTMEKGFSDLDGEFLYRIVGQEVDPSLWPEVAKQVADDMGVAGKELTPKHIEALQFFRDFMEYKANEFGLPPWTYIENYATAIREHRDIMYGAWGDATAMKRILSDKVDIPNEHLPFFMQLRDADMVELAEGTNIFDVMKTYSRSGNRQRFMNPIRSEFEEAIKEGDIPTTLGHKMDVKLRDAYGGSDPDTIRSQIDRINRKYDKAKEIRENIEKYPELARDPEKKATAIRQALLAERPQDVFSASMASSLMGLNLRLPIRNLFQIQTHTAPVLGIKMTEMGMMDIVLNKTLRRELKAEYIRRGIITDFLPNQTRTLGGKVKRFSQWTTGLYKASDIQNRLITGQTARLRFNSVADELLSNRNMDNVARDLRLDFLDTGSQTQILDLMSSGQLGSARNLYEDRMIQLTQFNYDPSNTPRAHRGLIGKAFGAYSTYPLQTLQLWKKGLTSKHAAGFVATGTAMAGVTGIIMNDVLQLGGVPYDPTGYVAFQGGPYMDLAPMTLQGLGNIVGGVTSGDFGKVASAASGVATFIPAGNTIKRGIDAIGLYQDGEIMEATLRAMGATKSKGTLMFQPTSLSEDGGIGGDAIDSLLDLIPDDFGR